MARDEQDRRSSPKESLRKRPLRRWPFGVAGLATLLAVCGAERARPAPAKSPMDIPLKLIAHAQASYKRVEDYTCVLVKQERIGGELTPNNVVLMMVRCRPFSVFLRWKDPEVLGGQEVCYVEGRHDGKMRVKPPGLLGAVGFVTVDSDDPRAGQSSNHTVKEAGIGNLIVRLARSWKAEKELKTTRVRVGEYEYAKVRCYRVETTHLKNPDKRFQFHRTVVYFNKETFLPVRIECYNWPSKSDKKGELQEVFNFINLRVNVGLKDAVFER